MLQYENTEDGRIRHYSDAGMMIRQIETGVLYEEAVDVLPCRYTYEESETLIPVDEVEQEATAQELLDIIVGSENQ